MVYNQFLDAILVQIAEILSHEGQWPIYQKGIGTMPLITIYFTVSLFYVVFGLLMTWLRRELHHQAELFWMNSKCKGL